MPDDLLAWLERWYAAHCDGDWEHQHGVKLNTIDNPGWRLDIDLARTGLSGVAFSEIRVERADDDWVFCWVEDNVFRAACGPLNLIEAIQTFRAWVASHGEQLEG